MEISEFVSDWKSFVENLHEVLEKQLRRRNSRPGDAHLNSLLEGVISDITSPRGISEMEEAVGIASLEDADSVSYMHKELLYFNEAYANGDGDAEEQSDDGDTIKSSIEELFRIPEWLKKRLKFLNELLKILRGG